MKLPLTKTTVFAAITVASISIILSLTYAFAAGTKLFLTLKVFSQVFDLVQRYHVEKVSESELIQGAIDGMLSRLDPYSALLVSNDLQQWQSELTECDSNIISGAIIKENEIGYLKIRSFSAQTGEDFKTHLYRLQKNGMEKLILDLRGNSGGYLNAAVEVCDQLLPEGKKIVTVNKRAPGSRRVYFSNAKDKLNVFPIIVLIDSATASAAEIVAGALQDWDRALIMGFRSAGKGLVQNQHQLSDSLALLLSSARYFLPSGRSIQRDYNSVIKNYKEVNSTPFANASHTKKPTSPLFYRTSSGRPVHGNEGIAPDIFFRAASNNRDSLVNFASFHQTTGIDTVCNQSPKMMLQNFVSIDDTLLLVAIQNFDQAQLLLLNKSWVNEASQAY